ncbi:DUF664 domain-containing protein [Lapillicoccus sp.]|uniref:mycothiol transferase n=1 Tax=Lapillicoccus sp. TaxID=1909287 RepID=UPI003982DA57
MQGTHRRAARRSLVRLHRTEEDSDLDFNHVVADGGVVAEAWDTWRGEVAHARAAYADLDLDVPVDVNGQEAEARDIVVHLVEDYAGDAGHADPLRECIDGRTSGDTRQCGGVRAHVVADVTAYRCVVTPATFGIGGCGEQRSFRLLGMGQTPRYLG